MSDLYEIGNTKYLTLIGHIQSGKTIEEINYCYSSIKKYQLPVIFIVRNITADQLQLRDRFTQSGYDLNVNMLNTLDTDQAVTILENLGVLILLCNEHQLKKCMGVLVKYRGEYNLCIDEVDFSIKTKNFVSKIDIALNNIKNSANHILGATATPFAVFSCDRTLTKVKKINPNKNYRPLESLNIEYLTPNTKGDFPYCDQESISKIYSTLLLKDHAFLLHTVVKELYKQKKLFDYIRDLYPQFTVLTYNGDGIRVCCPRRYGKPLAKKRSLNKYWQMINKYHSYDDGTMIIHYFTGYSISEVLQILVNDPEYSHTHISVISGQLASRGISFVSSDYSLHLTDQYFHSSPKTHGENLLQSLRILGCYKDTIPLTLWCAETTWESIVNQNEIINKLVNDTQNSREWLVKLTQIQIDKPKVPMTRPGLSRGVRFKGNGHNCYIEIENQIESDSEIESS
jgi:hypothetical protein